MLDIGEEIWGVKGNTFKTNNCPLFKSKTLYLQDFIKLYSLIKSKFCKFEFLFTPLKRSPWQDQSVGVWEADSVTR